MGGSEEVEPMVVGGSCRLARTLADRFSLVGGVVAFPVIQVAPDWFVDKATDAALRVWRVKPRLLS
jgi:hypothetical protein